jgi:hypothetical protein
MTAPVVQEAAAEKIAMTAPVTQEAVGKEWLVAFVMPAQYTIETLPEPLDPAVRLRERPGTVMAAVAYSGTWRQSVYRKKRQQLEAFVAARGYAVAGPALFARYNSPMTLPFMRRNEVLIPVEPAPHR